MRARAGWLALAALLLGAPAHAGDAVVATFAYPVERVWAATTAALDAHGWGIDDTQPALGVIVTKTSRLSGGNEGPAARSVRLRLRVRVIAVDQARTTVSVEREALRRERLLWDERETAADGADPLAGGGDLERRLLAAIAQGL